MARDIKASSPNYINENNWVTDRFEWQGGYGAFTYSRSRLNQMVQYIRNQPKHHRRHIQE